MMSYRHEMPAARTHYPTDRPNVRPERRVRPKGPPPLDAEDLSRRLYVVLAEREARARKRQHDRNVIAKRDAAVLAAAEGRVAGHDRSDSKGSTTGHHDHGRRRGHATAAAPGVPDRAPPAYELHDSRPRYHHVPEVAASQFARTTAPAETGGSAGSLVRKLSRRALGLASNPHGTEDRRTGAHPPPAISEEATQAAAAKSFNVGDVHYRQRRLAHRHTFEPSLLAHAMRESIDGDNVDEPKRFSEGAILRHRSPVYEHEMPVGTMVDWTQSDENAAAAAAAAAGMHGEAASQPRHLADKPDSVWAMVRQRLIKTPPRVDDAATSPPQPKSPMSPRATKSTFFTRFKR